MVTIDKETLGYLSNIPLRDSFLLEHDKKKLLLNQSEDCDSPYLTESQARQYEVFVSIEDASFIDTNGVVLDDGFYLITAINDIDSNSNKSIIRYFASLDTAPDMDAITLPANLEKVKNHPNFVRGEAVVFAGFIKISNSMPVHIDNNSGHYKLTFKQAQCFVAKLIFDLDLEILTFEDYSPLLKGSSTVIYEVESSFNLSSVIFKNKSIQNTLETQSRVAFGYQPKNNNQVPHERYNSISLFFNSYPDNTIDRLGTSTLNNSFR